jgi:hypothetical protein
MPDEFRWGLAGLGPRKRVSQIPGLGLVWEKARKAIYYADLIVIVGFSFSGFDRLAQIEFARAMAGRFESGEPLPRVVVIDPNADSALMQRINSVFRPVEPIPCCHQEVEWSMFG